MPTSSESASTAATMTLTDFLLARIAEDEVVAREAAGAERPRGGWGPEESPTGERWETRDRRSGMLYVPSVENPADAALWDDEGGCDYMAPARPVGVHIARHDPARVLAECEAKRRIVEDLSPRIDEEATDPEHEGMAWAATVSRDVLWSLAFPYRDHPDFREEWRP